MAPMVLWWLCFIIMYIQSYLCSNLQSGAGHQRVSGSAARKRRSWNSSKRSSSAPSSRMARTSGRARASGHCGQAIPTRLSEISMRRYWRKQSVQARCWQEDKRGKWPRGWLRRQSGHSTRLLQQVLLTGRGQGQYTHWATAPHTLHLPRHLHSTSFPFPRISSIPTGL